MVIFKEEGAFISFVDTKLYMLHFHFVIYIQ